LKNEKDKKSTKKEIRKLEKQLKKKEKGLNNDVKQAISEVIKGDFADWHITEPGVEMLKGYSLRSGAMT